MRTKRRAFVFALGALAVGGLAVATVVPSLLRARMVVSPSSMPAPTQRPVAPSVSPAHPDPTPIPKTAAPKHRPLAQEPKLAALAQAPKREADKLADLYSFAPGGLARANGDLPAAQVAAPPEAWDEEGQPAFNTEAYDRIYDNRFLSVAANPLSTFSIDVDTASYANVRRFLAGGRLPPKDAVRIEELLNYFRYEYPEPRGEEPFSVSSELAACPWAPEHKLVLLGLKGRTLDQHALPPRNLVFLLDVSGSMDEPRKLPLLKSAMGLLVGQLRPQDRVAIVVYAGASGLVLPPTAGDRKEEIRAAIENLQAGGSTAGGAGIVLAYKVATESFLSAGINRVILATDGDFNVGVTNQGDLVRLIEEKRKSGVFLSVLGFGSGNLKDSTMEKLADSGNGNYSYIDTLPEARKVLVTESGATLVTIAKDVKIQVEFNPKRVAAYRLVGYENRMLRAEDFNDDRKDAGEIGAGHTVTALYEVVPVGVEAPTRGVDPLKYQEPVASSTAADSDELLTVKLRYKKPAGETSRLLSAAVREDGAHHPSANLRFSAAVAAFGMLLRDSEHKGSATYAQVVELARDAKGEDAEGYRAEFVQMVETAQRLAQAQQISMR